MLGGGWVLVLDIDLSTFLLVLTLALTSDFSSLFPILALSVCVFGLNNSFTPLILVLPLYVSWERYACYCLSLAYL